MKRQANPNQLHLCFSATVEPVAPKSEGVLVARWPDYPDCPGAFVRVYPYVLRDAQGRMGTERSPGLINSRKSLARSIENWHEKAGCSSHDRDEQALKNHAGWLQWHIFQMGGLGAAW